MIMDPDIDALIEELAFKYLLHLPSEEYENEVQLCYAFQLAHWEYLDAPETEHLTQKLSFSQFVIAMLDHTPEIGLNKQGVPNIVRMFKQMNWQIPVFGAILINEAMDKVLLTQTYIANNKGGAWMFPRGKVEKKDHGNSFDCACREVLEETGFDIRPTAHNDEGHYIERSIQAGNETKVIGLFLVPGIAEDYAFCSQTQGEVYQFAWFRIQDLWNHMKQSATIQVAGSPAKFLQVFPFMHGLSAFVNRHKRRARAAGRGAPAPAPGRAVRPPPEAAPVSAAGHSGEAGAHQNQLQPFHGDFDEEMAWEPSPKDRFGFEEMVQRNAQLHRGDAMRPYDGIIPQQQRLMQGRLLQQQVAPQQPAAKQAKGRQHGEAAAPGTGAAPGGGPGGQHEYLQSTLLPEASSETLSARQLGSRNSLGAKRSGRTKRGKAKADRSTTEAPPATLATAASPDFAWRPLQLTLPEIAWHGQASGPFPGEASGAAKPDRTDVKSHIGGRLGSADEWLRFELDRGAVMRELGRCLTVLDPLLADAQSLP